MRVSRQLDGIGMSGICITELSFDVPGDLEVYRAAEVVLSGVDGVSTFYIDNRTKSGGVTSVTCLDKLALADAAFPDSSITGSDYDESVPIVTVKELIASTIGIDSVGALPSWLSSVPRAKLKDATCSEVLNFIAEACCGFFYMVGSSCQFIAFGNISSAMSISQHTALDIGAEYSPVGVLCTDGNGVQYSRGSVGNTYDTIQIDSDLITDAGCAAVWEKAEGVTLKQFSCDKAIVASVPYPAVQITFGQGYELIAHSIECEITACGIVASLSGNVPSDSEIGSRHRLTRNKIEYGKRSGNVMHTKYQGTLVLDDEEE